MKKSLIAKIAGGLFAVGIAASALIGQPGRASADGLVCSPPKCPVIQFRPDLTVTDLQVDKVVNHLIIQVTIMNDGIVPANGFRTDIVVNGQVVKSFVESGLPQGNGRYYVFDMIVPDSLTKASVQAIVDAGHTVTEYDELNNSQLQVLSW